MKKLNLKKLTVTAILAAVAVVGSLFSFPVFGSKCTAPGKCFMRRYRRTMVGAGTGFYCVTDP